MTTVGTFRAELVFSHPPHRATGAAIVPAESFDFIEAEMVRFGVATRLNDDTDPQTRARRPAFTPIEGGRLALVEGRGIQHGDRFVATFDVNEVNRPEGVQRQMWLVDAEPLLPGTNSTAS